MSKLVFSCAAGMSVSRLDACALFPASPFAATVGVVVGLVVLVVLVAGSDWPGARLPLCFVSQFVGCGWVAQASSMLRGAGKCKENPKPSPLVRTLAWQRTRLRTGARTVKTVKTRCAGWVCIPVRTSKEKRRPGCRSGREEAGAGQSYRLLMQSCYGHLPSAVAEHASAHVALRAHTRPGQTYARLRSVGFAPFIATGLGFTCVDPPSSHPFHQWLHQ